MAAYISIFLLALGGMIVLFWRKYSIVKDFSEEEIEARLNSSVSVRTDLKETILDPAKAIIYDEHLPALWRVLEKLVRRVRVVALRVESRLGHLSDKLRGKHVNMNVEEKSEYWKTLGDAKKNVDGNGNGNNKATLTLTTTETQKLPAKRSSKLLGVKAAGKKSKLV